MRTAVVLSILCCGAVTGAIRQPTFLARRDYPFYAPVVTVADVNGDKIPDMIVTSPFGNDISIWLGNGFGAFSAGPTTVTEIS